MTHIGFFVKPHLKSNEPLEEVTTEVQIVDDTTH